ncbi:MAG: valine--tRNA ligase [Chitinophagaceae bacterium]|nr:valine--tRNA ligase [Chitinophagaceae bacterium]MBK8311454.1 valine--tRNA ligase [Chitinophagaceae bacterium]MBP6476888.1 valine--tRNA ligase [Chitinophagaceae bacterium]MBP7108382.1 valine--tRNA ligase [Chitinophagaceae bacterium]MBP7314122.1 valine--tRNA ligase [Chitinophagaceae bacterium]
MELSKNFDHQSAEQKWYQHWLDKNYFHSEPDDREPYTIVIPPPNVTGVLHMGHCLNNTIQDILIRRARMQGKNACWVPGTDHASIATEAKVVQMLREKGIAKSSLSREDFLKYAWEWKEKYGGIILQQLKKMGCSLDWDRTSFTMDPDYYQSVINVFIDLHNKGFIYRGKRMINWDVKAKTALSDEEVIRKETQQKLYHLKYKLDIDKEEYITIATVRPETIMGDTAICVHPDDDRYKHLHGKFAFVPLINRRIPIITDDYVTMDFGTGALKVTPAHDMNDNQLGQKHNLEVVDIFNEDGTLNAEAQIYVGEDRFAARKKIAIELEEKGFLLKTEDYTSEVGYSERTNEVVEPRLSLQWWVDMKKISGPALSSVIDDEVKFYPAKFKNLYRHWMENIKDWCISRQLWWGHRIPAWYDNEGRFVVAATEEQAKKMFNEQFSIANADLKQDEDCLDTWFSSWLWPFEVFKGYSNPNNKEVNYYYPTNTLVTAPEIIFFWVARMIMAGFEYKGEKPFNEVYFTGIVRDKQGRKMSKSLGNSPDLIEMIEKDGADAVRFGIMISSPAGNDLMWDQAGNEQGRFFINKMWNALKLIKMWEGRQNDLDNSIESNFATEWFENRLSEVRAELDSQFKDFNLSAALKTIYSLIWDDFCSWYLEWVKPGFEQPIDKAVYEKTIGFFEELMQLLHPFMPFVTEEIYHQLKDRTDDLTVKQYPATKNTVTTILSDAAFLKEVITTIRDARNKNQLKPKDTINLHIQTENKNVYTAIESILLKQVNAESISYTSDNIPNSITVVVQKDKIFIETTALLDTSSQKQQLQKDLDYLKGFLISVDKKLSNEKFVQNAKPEVIEIERKKKADAEEKIKVIEGSLTSL